MQQMGEEAAMNDRERGEGGRRERGEERRRVKVWGREGRRGVGRRGGRGVGGAETADCLGVCCRQRRQVSETITLMVLSLTLTTNDFFFFKCQGFRHCNTLISHYLCIIRNHIMPKQSHKNDTN